MIPRCSDALTAWESLSRVTPISLALVSIAVVALLTASASAIVGDIFGRKRVAAPQGDDGGWAHPALWLSVLFLIAFSAKLFLMRLNPVTTPFWDQWDAEGATIYVPFQRCALTWRTMFQLHNEHRIFMTRLLALDLLATNGQWDPRLEQVANAIIHAFTAVLVAATFWLSGQRQRLDLIALVCSLAFALPFSWENTLGGFQSAFYFLVLFSVLAIWLTTRHPAGSVPWGLGWLCAAGGIVSAASGPIIPAAIAGMAALKLANDRRGWRDALINGGALLLVFALGVSLTSPPLAHHATRRAQTVSDFFVSLGHNLAWPWTLTSPLVSIVMWLPLAALLVAIASRRGRASDLERFVVGMGIWVALQGVAVAYARGARGALTEGRYMDFLSLGFVANTMAVIAFLDRARPGGGRRIALGVFASWLLCGMVGVDRLTNQALLDLGAWREYFLAHAANVRSYVVTHDLTTFVSKRPLAELPYPDPNDLASYLQYPDILRILPSSIREPLRVMPLADTSNAFVLDGSTVKVYDPLRRTWGSFTDQGRAAQGRFDSQIMASCKSGGRLQFQVSGYLGWSGHYLAVKEQKSGRETAVRPSRVPKESWVSVTVPCPSGPFTVVAVDAAADSWFAFREPVEVGGLSLLSEWLIGKARGMLLVSLGLALLSARWASRRSSGTTARTPKQG